MPLNTSLKGWPDLWQELLLQAEFHRVDQLLIGRGPFSLARCLLAAGRVRVEEWPRVSMTSSLILRSSIFAASKVPTYTSGPRKGQDDGLLVCFPRKAVRSRSHRTQLEHHQEDRRHALITGQDTMASLYEATAL